MAAPQLAFHIARLQIAFYDALRDQEIRDRYGIRYYTQEHEMSVQIDGLTDMVKYAKSAISQASEAASRVQGSATRLAGRVNQVNDLVSQIDKAEAELGAAIGEMTNGGPPLNDPLPPVAFVPGAQ